MTQNTTIHIHMYREKTHSQQNHSDTEASRQDPGGAWGGGGGGVTVSRYNGLLFEFAEMLSGFGLG